MDPEMKKGLPTRYRPLDGDRNSACSRENAEAHGSFNIVMISEGNERVQLERVFNLPGFHFERLAGSERRSPPGPAPINTAIPARAFDSLAEKGNFRGVPGNEVEALFGMDCMGVKRYRGAELS